MNTLPTELLSSIIQCLRPSGSPVAIPATHEVTKALLALTSVSSRIRSLAAPYLYDYCLYIDSPSRLQLLLRTLCSQADILRNEEHAFRESAGDKSLGPFLRDRGHGVLKSLYLAPFTQDTIKEPPVVQMIASLFEIISPCLTRLVIDMPLRSLYPEEDISGPRSVLNEAFQRLTALEEFTSAQDELFLDTLVAEQDVIVRQPLVWRMWPRLKHLALYNVDVDSQRFRISLEKLQNLEVIVLTRADGEQDASTSSLLSIKSLKRVLIVNTKSCHPRFPVITGSPQTLTKSERYGSRIPEIVRISVPIIDEEEAQDIEVCLLWTRDKAMNGQLWDEPAASLSSS